MIHVQDVNHPFYVMSVKVRTLITPRVTPILINIGVNSCDLSHLDNLTHLTQSSFFSLLI